MKASLNEGIERSAIIVITALFIVLILTNVFGTTMAPMIWDPAIHFMDSIKYYQAIRTLSIHSMITIDRYYPPLATLIPIPIHAINSPDPRVGIFIENAVFIVILVYALYKLSEFTGSRVPSIIAVFAVLTSPLILDQAITFMLDIPLTAMAVLTWYLLLKSNGFRSRRYSVLSGISLGAGLLAKWTFPIFVMVPVFYELKLFISPLTLGIRGILKQRKNELKNILTLGVLALLVAGW